MSVDPARLRPWKQLERDARSCTDCRLWESRSKVVFGEGDVDADLMFVGEAPGRSEDLTGRPFAGAAGNILDNFLGDVGLTRDEVYVTDLVMCRPPQGRRPSADEIEAHMPYLAEQIAHVRPRVIVAFGELVAAVLAGRPLPLERVAGYRFDVFDGVTLIPTYRPTEAVKGSARALTAIKRDVATAKAVLDGRIATGADLLAEARARQSQSDA
ncbi:MAG: uracil-DNA glycosylase [Actinobacteria bacterium]|nr:uracil-DNA glycosylase [Actinomycetota bacterium]